MWSFAYWTSEISPSRAVVLYFTHALRLGKTEIIPGQASFFFVVVVKNKQIHKKGKPIRDTRLSLEIC